MSIGELKQEDWYGFEFSLCYGENPFLKKKGKEIRKERRKRDKQGEKKGSWFMIMFT